MMYHKITRCRQTGTEIEVGTAEDLGVDPAGGRWVTICLDHGSICNHNTLALARSHASCPQWCEECQALGEGAP